MKQKSKSWALLGTVLALTGYLLTGGAALAATDTIIYARGQDANTLDSHKASDSISLQAMTQIYGSLVHSDAVGNIVGGLAESYSVSEDGKTYTFKMRGVKCHDGTVFDAAAAKWNFDRVLNPDTGSPMASSYGEVTSTRVEGDNMIVELAAPYSALLAYLSGPSGLAMCPSTIQGEDVNPVGTGPWKFVSWDRNNELVFERYEGHVNFHPMIENPGAPHMKRLIYKLISEGPARMAALKTGEVTFAEPSLPDAAELKDDSDYAVYTSGHTGQVMYIGFNHNIPPFDDVRARRAVGYAVDRNVMANIAFEGLVEPIHCPIAPGQFASDPAKCGEWGTAYDPEKAKALLAELGYGPDNPLEVILSEAPLQGWTESIVIIKQQLAEVGITGEIQGRQYGVFVDWMSEELKKTEGTPMIYTHGWSGMDPDYLRHIWASPGYMNGGIADPVLNKMLLDQSTMLGDPRRDKLQEIAKYVLENGYEIPLVSPAWFWLQASKSNVKGFVWAHMVTPMFNDVTIED